MDEEKIDRRIHWAYWLVAGVVVATTWCVKMQFELAGMKSEFETQKMRRDDAMSKIWEKIGTDHDTLTKAVKDIEWMKRENGGH